VNRVAQLPVQAFAVALGAVAVLSIMDAVMKHLVLAIGIVAVSVWRAAANLLASAVLYLPNRRSWPSAATTRVHVLRSVIVTVMAALFFWGIGRVPLAQAIALTFIAPLIAQGLAVLLLDERMKRGALIGSALGFGGVLVILGGQAGAHMGPDALWGAVAVLLSAVCYAYNIILMRKQAQLANPYEVAFFQSVIVAICLSFAMPWFAHLPPAEHVPMILLGALLATASLALLGWAYARAEASYLAPVEFTAFIWASLWGFAFFGETVRLTTLLGAGLIVAGCLIAARAPDMERDVVP